MDSLKYKISKPTSKIKKFWLNFWFKILSIIKAKKISLSKIGGPAQAALDKKLVFSLSKSRIPNWQQFKYIKEYLSPKELRIIYINLLIILLCSVFYGVKFYSTHLRVIPIAGGHYTEAVIGSPKYINPLYANISDTDDDISRLIYSSLFKYGKNGKLTKDIVKDYTISKDNKIYTFTIRNNARWHDSKILPSNLSTDDIVFTFKAIQDRQYKSPLRASFIGVAIKKISQQKFEFILKNPYAAFLELLTFGIMPAEIWSRIPPESFSLAELNLKPIGSGPYKFNNLVKDTSGKIIEYNLIANNDYYNNPPLIDISYKFFPNFSEAVAALNDNRVDGMSYLPPEFMDKLIAPKTFNFHKLYLPQLTAIFLNLSKSILVDKKVRQALAISIDKNKIIKDILVGEAYAVDGPILPSSFAYDKSIKKYSYNPEEANKLLDQAGWKLKEITAEDISRATPTPKKGNSDNTQEASTTMPTKPGQWREKDNQYLIINLTTVERKENREIVEAIKTFWEQVGVKTELSIVPAGQIQNKVIKPRNFTALFYSQVTGADPDPYAFWHSSQIGKNGFNIANFSNKKVDQLIEDARLISNPNERREKYIEFQEILTEQLPAIFMYSPTYTYVQSKKIKNFDVTNILRPGDRLANVEEWYIKTGKKIVW